MKKPEFPWLNDKEAAHCGRAAKAAGLDKLDEWAADFYERLYHYGLNCGEYVKWLEKEAEGTDGDNHGGKLFQKDNE